ncbi:MAG: FG-GAP-like repeat-containing protein [Bacteroidota bacterium]
MRVLLLPLVLASVASAQAPRVVSVSPAPNAVSVDRDTEFVLQFDRALDAATVDDTSVRVFGRWSGPARGSLTVDGDRVRFRPDAPFMAGETVTVSVSRRVASGGVPMAHGMEMQVWTRSEPITSSFVLGDWITVRQPGEGRITSYGAYAGDLDGDGDSDLAVPNELTADVRVFLNDGSGGYEDFVIYPLPDGNWPSPSEGADFDHDGEIDIVVGNANNEMLSVMLGDGAGSFSSIVSYPTTGTSVRGLAVLDADGDGHDDVITANRSTGTLSRFMGRGDGTFDAPTTLDAGGFGETALASGDADGDGILDLFVGAIGSDEVILMLGDGEGGFAVSDRISTPGAPWMLAAGDLDGDGDADVVSAGSHADVVDVVLSNGDGTLASGATLASGDLTIAVDLGDLDGDGILDLVSSNYFSGDFYVYRGDGVGGFAERQRLAIEGAGSCAVLHDRDGDGVLDITAIDEVGDRIYFVEHVVSPSTEPGAAAPVRLDLVSPNPASGAVRVRLSGEAGRDAHVTVVDALGRTVATLYDGTVGSVAQTLVWEADVTPGVYTVWLRASGARGSVRVTRL